MTFESDSKPEYEIKPCSGRAFKNKRAREGGKDAHMTGTFVDEHGQEHFLDIWVNAKDPDVQDRLIEAIKYLNLRTKKKDKSRVAPSPGETTSRPLAPTQGSFPETTRYDAAPERASKPAAGDRPKTAFDLDDEIPF